MNCKSAALEGGVVRISWRVDFDSEGIFVLCYKSSIRCTHFLFAGSICWFIVLTHTAASAAVVFE